MPAQRKNKAKFAIFTALAFFCLLNVPTSGETPISAPASNALKGLKAPGSPETPWQPPDLQGYASILQVQEGQAIDPQKTYDLSELIDLAESVNPKTKSAWEQAKKAAAAVGLARSEYFPILALRASGSTVREPLPVPVTASTSSYLDLYSQGVEPVAQLEWTLLDFGRRKARVDTAKEQLLAANLGFNSQHQVIVFSVQKAFYELCKVRGRTDVAQSSLDAALKVQEAAQERFTNGLSTAPDVSLAQQQAVQAAFDLEEVRVEERDAQVVLAQNIGITPDVPFQVVDFSKLPVPANLQDTVEEFIQRALKQRPDLLAQVAALRGKEGDVRRARAEYYPTLSFQGEAGGSFDRAQMDFLGNTIPWINTRQPIWDAGFSLSWNLFEGGARKRKLEIAKAELNAAQHELDDERNQAISQVWQAYTDTELATRRLAVAQALVEASDKSYQQTFEAYQNGLSSIVDVLSARRELSQARYEQLDTRATVLESAASLAFASGDLGPQLLKRKLSVQP